MGRYKPAGKTASVYLITNLVNGKRYVGFTSREPAWYWQTYSYPHHYKNLNRPIYQAIHKYGILNFSFRVLYRSTDIQHTLNVMENYFITKYNTLIRDGKGYNVTTGGEGTWGKKNSDSCRKKISDKWKDPEYRRKKFEASAKEYIVIDKDGNKQKVVGISQWCRANNLSWPSMHHVITGKRRHTGNWRAVPFTKLNWSKIYLPLSEIPNRSKTHPNKKMELTTPTGKKYIFESFMAAARKFGLSGPTLCDIAKGRKPDYHGFTCRYL